MFLAMSLYQNRFRAIPVSRAGLVAAAGAVVLMTAGCKPERKETAQAPQPVQVMQIAPMPTAQSWSYVGTVRPRFETDLAFRVAGKIVERGVDVGQAVASGQVIARLDTTDYRLSLEAQQAELMAARSSRDQAVAAEARFRTLLAQGHVAKAALDQRQAAADEARGRFDRAERSLELARNQLAYAELKADHAGVISALQVESGQVVVAGQAVARIARRDSLEAEVAIPEQMIEAVRRASATAEIWGADGARVAVTLRELSPEADRVSRTFRARFSMPESTLVALGRTVTVHLSADGTGEVAQVPLAAVMSDGRGAMVWAVDDSGTRVRRMPVRIAQLGRDHVLIAGGIAAGDRIVTLGVHMLDEAKPVRIVESRVIQR